MVSAKEFYTDLPEIQTERLLLRKFVSGDAADVYAYAGSAEVTKFLRWGPHADINFSRTYISEVMANYEKGADGPWAIELTSTGRVVGSIHLIQFDTKNQAVEIGYVLARENWNRGIMTEAMRGVVDYCFDRLGVVRVQAMVIDKNAASARVLEKAGLSYEGTLGYYLFQKDRHWNAKMYAIINPS